MIQRFGARMSMFMPRRERTRKVPEEAEVAATIVPKSTASDRNRITISMENAPNAARLKVRRSLANF
jgi:hypothetical protein